MPFHYVASASQFRLMINEAVLSGQATDGISPDVTNFFERKTMSTKTTFKRVALVAVVALGLGGLSTVAAHAATTSLSVTGVARAGLGIQLTVTSDDPTATDNIHYALISGPAGSAVPTGANGNPLSLGTKKIDITDNTAATAVINAAGALAASIATPPTVYTPVTPTTVVAAGVYRLLVWGHTGSAVAPVAGDIATIVTVTAGGAPSQINLTSPTANVPNGTSPANAKFVVSFQDANGVATFINEGSTESVALTVTPSTGNAYLNITALATGAGAITTATALSAGVNATSTGSSALIPGYSFYLGNSTSSYNAVKVSGSGLLYGITAGTGSFTASTIPTSSVIAVTTPAALKGTTTPATANGVTSITASTTTAASIKYTFTGSAAGSLPIKISANGTKALPAGVVAGTYYVTLADVSATSVPSFKGTYTVTSTAPAASTGYVISGLSDGAGTFGTSLSVAYASPVVSSGSGTITLTPADDIVSAGVYAKAVTGSTQTVTAKVVDQFGVAVSGANVWFSVTGYNTVASTLKTTNATGVATFTYTDAKATGGTDAISVVAASPTSTTTLDPVLTHITYGTAYSVGTVKLVNSGTAYTDGNKINGASATLDSATTVGAGKITATATVKDANGAILIGVPVTFSVSAGGYSLDSTSTVWTSSSGVASATFGGSTTGTVTISAVAGSVTATTPVTFINTSSDARILSLSAPTVSLVGGKTAQVIATVKDLYGNVVPGAAVRVTYAGTAGRVQAVGGIIGSEAKTGTNGTTTIDISAYTSEAGLGTLKAAISNGDATDETVTTLANDGVTAYPAAVVSASTTVTVTAAPVDTSAVDATKAAQAALAAAQTALAKQITDFAAAQAAAATAAATAAADKAAADKAAAAAAVTAAAATAVQTQAAIDAAQAATDASNEATDAANAATDAANNAMDSADAAQQAALDAGDKADAALAAISDLSMKVADIATSVQALSGVVAKIASSVAKISAKVKA